MDWQRAPRRSDSRRRNYYDILQVPKNSSQDDLRKDYKRAAMKHHPDKGGDVEKFLECALAYEVLSDSERRVIYDKYGENKHGYGSDKYNDDRYSEYKYNQNIYDQQCYCYNYNRYSQDWYNWYQLYYNYSSNYNYNRYSQDRYNWYQYSQDWYARGRNGQNRYRKEEVYTTQIYHSDSSKLIAAGSIPILVMT